MSRPLLQAATGRTTDWVCVRCAVRKASRITGRLQPKRNFHVTRRNHEAEKDKSVLALLEERGYVNQIAGDRNTLDKLLRRRQVGFYAGIDPTAPSLHLGHLLPLMVLFWLYHHGHKAVSLAGGFTARVGDPSGRLTSRAEAVKSVHDANFDAMYSQLGRIWENAASYGKRHGFAAENAGQRELLDNASWLGKLQLGEFLQVLGHRTRIGPMLGRDTVRNKLEKGDGMTFSEFTYPLLQGWDWWHMYQHNDVQVQIGGSDQFGNIIAGMDVIKFIAQSGSPSKQQQKLLDKDGKLKDDLAPMGLTVPLLTTASGEKFGKSAGNAVWLDQSMTPAFDLYGFLLRSSDADVGRYLKLFTFVPSAEIADIMTEHATNPGKRKAQHLLAGEVLELVHGQDVAKETRIQHESLRNPSLSARAPRDEAGSMADKSASPSSNAIILPASLVYGMPFPRILYHSGLVGSKSAGTRLITTGGAYVAGQNEPPHQEGHIVGWEEEREQHYIPLKVDQTPEDVKYFGRSGGHMTLRIGKWKVRGLTIIEDADFDARGLQAPGWEEFKEKALKK
ncbi:tyrosyl-tRNA synthetase [Recurvomyces mirabilis]|nr:tyrosyl-tRNA synthetase [Recurvomyces mirabilis]